MTKWEKEKTNQNLKERGVNIAQRNQDGGQDKPTKKLLTPFKAPTVGMEEIFFTTGSTRDAAKFEETKLKLSRYIKANWKAGRADIGRALEDLIAADYEESMDTTPEQEAIKVFMEKWEGLHKASKGTMVSGIKM